MGMDMQAAFSGKYLKASDLDGSPRTLKIACVTLDTVGQGDEAEKKHVLHCEDCKPIVLNKTNGDTLVELHGRDSDQWVGELVEVFPTTTQFGPKTVDCIRMREPLNTPF